MTVLRDEAFRRYKRSLKVNRMKCSEKSNGYAGTEYVTMKQDIGTGM